MLRRPQRSLKAVRAAWSAKSRQRLHTPCKETVASLGICTAYMPLHVHIPNSSRKPTLADRVRSCSSQRARMSISTSASSTSTLASWALGTSQLGSSWPRVLFAHDLPCSRSSRTVGGPGSGAWSSCSPVSPQQRSSAHAMSAAMVTEPFQRPQRIHHTVYSRTMRTLQRNRSMTCAVVLQSAPWHLTRSS